MHSLDKRSYAVDGHVLDFSIWIDQGVKETIDDSCAGIVVLSEAGRPLGTGEDGMKIT